MRGAIWLILVFSAAVVAALTLGRNDGLVSLYWAGWRVDLSLNLFLLGLLVLVLGLYAFLQSAQTLLSLPKRALAWRLSQRDRSAQALLRDAIAALWGGRYARAQRAAQRLIALQQRSAELQPDPAALALAHLLAAEAAHHLQDRPQRQQAQDAALAAAREGARELEEAVRLRAVGWSLDDRDAEQALRSLAELPAGVARRTQALRHRLQAARLAKQLPEALRAARLLIKHQGFPAQVARSLLRSLAFEWLDTARDADQLRQVWNQLEITERRDPAIASRAAQAMAGHGAALEARAWLKPLWDSWDVQVGGGDGDERAEALVTGLLAARTGMGADWLPSLEAALKSRPRDAWLPLLLGWVLLELQLWGKATGYLSSAAADARLPATWRRRCWLALAERARAEGRDDAQLDALMQAAQLP